MAEHIDIVKKSLIRRSSADASVLDYGKLPPQAKEIEEAVLGAVMIEKNAMIEIGDMLKDESFYVDAHQRIWRAIRMLYQHQSPIDLLTVTEQLKANGELDAAGGPWYIAQLTNKVGSAANVEYHATVLAEKHIQRLLISAGTSVVKEAYEDTTDPLELMGNALTIFSDVVTYYSKHQVRMFTDLLSEKIQTIERASVKEGDEKFVIGKPTGLYTLDRKSLGFKDTNLIILAGRPAEGKSTLMVQGAHFNATKKTPVGIFSLEMSEDELLDKFISIETGIDSVKIQTGNLKPEEWEKIHNAQARMAEYPIFIDDTSGTLPEIEANAKLWVTKFGIQILYIDYLQLVEVGIEQKKRGNMNREQELSMISRRLKKLAKALGIPVIALCALSREMDKRPVVDRRPKLIDLRESGAIEQDANLVIFVFRPEEHGISHFADQSPTKGITEFIIAKNRMGKKGVARAKFLGAHNRFDDSEFSHYTIEYSEGTPPPSGPEEDTPF